MDIGQCGAPRAGVTEPLPAVQGLGWRRDGGGDTSMGRRRSRSGWGWVCVPVPLEGPLAPRPGRERGGRRGTQTAVLPLSQWPAPQPDTDQ